MSEQSPSSPDGLLHRKAREAIRARTLPARSPDRIWGGIGSGARCCICGASIGPDQTELELEFVPEDRSKSSYFIVHLRCFSIFEVERQLLVPQGVSANAREASVVASASGATS